ncbi:hypothetical protein [Enhygromyxa salina]|nr:hypothetical protein [Enhygromyxa salina]
MKLGFLALLLIPLLLVLHAPVLAAVVPGALLTVASLGAMDRAADQTRLPPAPQVIGADDLQEHRRVAAATPIHATSRRVG